MTEPHHSTDSRGIRRQRRAAIIAAVIAAIVHGTAPTGARAAEWTAPVAVESSTAAGDLYPAVNLINGSGLSRIPSGESIEGITHGAAGPATAWVTADPPPGGGDWFQEGNPNPILTFTLPERGLVSAVAIWGYGFSAGSPNNNEARRFAAAVSTDDGATWTPAGAFDHERSNELGVVHPLNGVHEADLVRLTITDNHFGSPGAAGGDRVGLGEIRFLFTPASAGEPSPSFRPVIDFGFVDPEATATVEGAIEIMNSGSAGTLVLTDPRLGGPDADRFRIAPGPVTVAPGASAGIPVTLVPGPEPDALAAWVTFSTNAASRPRIHVGLLASVGDAAPGTPPEPPVFSTGSRTFVTPFQTTAASLSPDALVVVTFDGTLPSADNGVLAIDPIEIAHSTEIRAAAMAAGGVSALAGASHVRLSPELAGYRSPLPVVVIDNFGSGTIPDKGWTTNTQTGAGLKQRHRQPAAFLLMSPGADGAESSINSAPSVASRIGIRVRGAFSSTWFPKPYSFESWDQEGADQDIAPLGMAADSDWILYYPHASYDRTMLYNTFIWELSRATGRWAPDFRFIDVFINEDGGDLTTADRRGVYVLVEKVKRGRNRLDFDALGEDGVEGGWLLGINRMDPEPEDGYPAPNGATSPQFFHTPGPNRVLETPPNASGRGDDIPRQYNAFINFENPNGYEITPPQRGAIENWFREFENVFYDDAMWLDPQLGYRRFLDTRDFIGYFQLLNLARQSDGLLLSMFPWVSSGERRLRMGPMWDFNNGVYAGAGDPESVLYFRRDRLWYPRLFEDPGFLREYVDHWFEMRRGPLSNAAMDAIIDRQAATITAPLAVAQGMASASDWNARLAGMKSWLRRRADWIDRQYFGPPEFGLPGGIVAPGSLLEITDPSASGGSIHYTLDGSDPMPPTIGAPMEETVLLTAGAPANALIPTPANGGSSLVPADWTGTAPPPNAAAWIAGTTGAGFGYPDLTGLDLGAMKGVTGSAYLRIPFEAPSAETLGQWSLLTLRMKFEDGFVAYINGTKVASANAPGAAFWNSVATQSRLDSDAQAFADFDVSAFIDRIQPGSNVLAIHLLNNSAGSSDVLALPELVAARVAETSPAAIRYSGPVALERSVVLSARTLAPSGEWSALNRATFITGTLPTMQSIVVSEIHYHPSEADEATEFIELLNIDRAATVDLSGSRFTEGIAFTFPAGSELAPGDRIVVARNPDALRQAFGDNVRIAGAYDGRLDNGGETIALAAPDGTAVRRFAYGDDPPWPDEADGGGFSLALRSPWTTPDHSDPASWRAGTMAGGSPGRPDGETFDGDPADDADGDGVPDLVAFALAPLHANGAAAAPNFLEAELPGDGSIVIRIHRRLKAAAEIQIEWSSDLREWVPSGELESAVPVAGSPGVNAETWRLSPGPSPSAPISGFVRLRVVPLEPGG